MLISIRLPEEEKARHFEKVETASGIEFTLSSFDGNTQTYSLREVAEERELPIAASSHVERTTRALYDQSISQALELIRSGEVSKIVLSRVEVVDKPSGFTIHNAFNTLCQKYPTACVYLLQHETFGCWLGATPEKLVSKDGDTCHTVALAGTLPNDPSQQWTSKEREEQAFVSESIRATLNDKNIVFEEGEVFDRVAGKIKHLCTPFSWKQSNGVLDLASALHPTPAVSGTPREVASALIAALEEHDRSLYTGFFGLRESHRESYFVNLRCMQVLYEQLAVYVGGGITADSDIESEWNETVLKSATMLEAL